MTAIELNARPHKDYSLHLQEAQHVLAQAAAQDAAKYNNENRIKDEKEIVDFFKAQGMKVITPNVDEFRKVVQAKYLSSEYAGIWPKGLLERINAVK